jgi:hypothetical protein
MYNIVERAQERGEERRGSRDLTSYEPGRLDIIGGLRRQNRAPELSAKNGDRGSPLAIFRYSYDGYIRQVYP